MHRSDIAQLICVLIGGAMMVALILIYDRGSESWHPYVITAGIIVLVALILAEAVIISTRRTFHEYVYSI